MIDVPQGWQLLAIHDVLLPLFSGKRIQQGKSPQCFSHPAPSDDVWGVLKTTSIQAGAFLPEHNKELPKQDTADEAIEVQPGDLLLTCAGPRSRCGVPTLVRTTRPRLLMSGKMYRFRANPAVVDAAFLEYYLLSPGAQKLIDQMKTGTSESGLNLTHSRFAALPTPVPPLDEQRRIVELLEAQLTQLDLAGQIALGAARRLRSLRNSLLSAELSKIDVAPVALGSILKCAYGKADDKSLRSEDGEYPVIGSAGIMTYTAAPLVSSPTVLVGRKGNVGSVQFVERECHPIDTVYWIEIPEVVSGKFLAYQLEALRLDRLDSSTAIPSLRREDLERLQIRIPRLEFQHQITQRMDAVLEKADRVAVAAQEVAQKASTLRKSLMSAAFSGQFTREFQDE